LEVKSGWKSLGNHTKMVDLCGGVTYLATEAPDIDLHGTNESNLPKWGKRNAHKRELMSS